MGVGEAIISGPQATWSPTFKNHGPHDTIVDHLETVAIILEISTELKRCMNVKIEEEKWEK